MRSEIWQRVQVLFEDALVLENDVREGFLQNSGVEAEILQIVKEMLRADEANSSLMNCDISEIACALLQEPEGDPSPPMKEFGAYHLIRYLGEGGMGVVWLARHADTGSQVAIKFLPSAWLSPARRERFTQEVRLLARLKHQCIARLYDAGTLADGTPWFVMEYVDGKSFTDFCWTMNSVEERLRLFRAVCDAVQYAHGQEIIHRDLKPSNILVEVDGTPKLLDFGIAREIQQSEVQFSLTAHGLRFFSPHYSAPEWIKDAEIGFTTDVYSLGVMLNEVFTGTLPVSTRNCSSDSDHRVQTNSALDSPRKAVESPNGTEPTRDANTSNLKITRSQWKDLRVLCLTAMHLEKTKRYRSVEALTRDIDHFLQGKPLDARPDSWSYRCGKFIHRNRVAVAAGASALALFALLSISFTVRLATAKNNAQTQAERANRVQQFMLGLFQSSGSAADRPANLTVEAVIDRGAAEVESLTKDAQLQADLYQNLGQMYRDIGLPQRAAPLYSKALDIVDRLPTASTNSMVNARIGLSGAWLIGNRDADAERLIREALQIAKQRAPTDLALAARIDMALGGVLSNEGKLVSAKPVLLSAVSSFEAVGYLHEDYADALMALSNIEIKLGNYKESDAASEKLVSLYSSVGRHNDPHMGDAFQNLGESAEARGRYLDADRYEREALKISEAWFGKEHRLTANKMSALALTLIDERKLGDAEALLNRAAIIDAKAYPPDSLLFSKTLKNTGMLQLASGKYDLALQTFDRVLGIYRAHNAKDDFSTSRMYLYEGEAYSLKGEFAQAEILLRKAVQGFLDARGENDVYTATARLKLGHVLLTRRRLSAAAQQLNAAVVVLTAQGMQRTDFMVVASKDIIAVQSELRNSDKAQMQRFDGNDSGIDAR